MTANVVDRSNGRTVATASTVEHAIKDAFDWGRSCNAKAAAAIGEVLAMRLRTEGLGSGVHIDAGKEIENKGLVTCPMAWAIVNALKSRGVKIIVDDHHH
ncbi:Ribosomal protein [Senna tora]|uniref:Ribosomal protein n=1 Tax=Senna tora TaxID=362788 RepID=A0A834W0A9_9FABA|nr:Ribosomal protein [Senna tora]